MRPSSRSSTGKLIVGVLLAAVCFVPSAGSLRADDVAARPARRFTRVPAPDGIQIRRYNKSDGVKPGPKDRVVVHYQGRLRNGTLFDRTRPGRPASFRLNAVIPCWTEALTRLRVGERAEVKCPAATAYGAKGSPPDIPGHAALTFEVELVGIQ